MKSTLEVGDIKAPPGQLSTGFLHIGELSDGWSPIDVPVMLLNGGSDGPTVYLHVGSHGQEAFYAVEAMHRLVRGRIVAETLRGSIIVVPVANVLAYQSATRVAPAYAAREQRAFAGDLHRGWPGRADGTLTERIADRIWTDIVSRSDLVIDYHSVSLPGIGFVYLYSGGLADRHGTTAWDTSVRLAKASGATVITSGQADTLTGMCLDAGKPGLVFEFPSPRMIREVDVRAAVQATVNVLSELGMIDEPRLALEPPPMPGLYRTLPSLRANRGGLIRYLVDTGVRLESGTLIAQVVDLFGNELEAVAMPTTGYVHTFPPLSWVGGQMVATGDWVADLCIEIEEPA